PGVVSTDQWYYLEVKFTVHDSTGSFDIRVNGVSVTSGTGVDTKNTSNAYVNQIRIEGPNATDFDDFYVCDLSGSVANDFIGPLRIETLMPTGDGAAAAWTPSTGSDHYALVDEIGPNGDTDYNVTNSAGNRDLFTKPAIASTGQVVGVAVSAYVRKDDAASPTVKLSARSGGNNYDSPNTIAPGSSFG